MLVRQLDPWRNFCRRAKKLLSRVFEMKPDPAIAIPSINRSKDTDWLTDFRARIVNLKVPKIVAAIDERLRELGEHDLRVAIAKPLDDLTLVGRVEEAAGCSTICSASSSARGRS